MKVVITGQHGFVGRHLADHLIACGDDVLACVDHAGTRIDVTDPEGTDQAINGRGVDVVYHLAALTHVGASFDDPAPVWRVNTEGTLQVLRAATRAGARVILISSADVYGAAAHSGRMAETEPIAPLSPYGASKAAAEMLAQQAFRSRGTDVMIVRAFNHTGPDQPPRFVIPALAQRIAAAERSGTSSVAVGNLDPIRDISDVTDIVAAYRLLALHGEAGETYNVGSGRGMSVREAANILASHARIPIELEPDPELVRPVDVPSLIADVTKLQATTAWKPTVPIEVTLAAVLDAARGRTDQGS